MNAFSLPPVAHGVVSAISPQLRSKEKHARHTSAWILVASSSTAVEMERNEEYLKNKDALKQVTPVIDVGMILGVSVKPFKSGRTLIRECCWA